MLRLVLWTPLLLTLTFCSSEDPSTPPCNYTSSPKQQLKLSTNPDTLRLPFDQQKLVALMWTPASQSECFVRKNGAIQLYKVTNARSSGRAEPKGESTNGTFVMLKPSPPQSMQNWRDSEEMIQSGASSNGPLPELLGLTHFKYYDVPQEKIVQTVIQVRAEGRPWHLWHEYAHYLIGVTRVQSPTANLTSLQDVDVQKALGQALNSKDNLELLQKEFQKFSDLQIDFIEKKYMDEILIESTLIELALQAPNDLPFDDTDVDDSRAVIHTFWMRYRSYVENAVDELRWETAGLGTEIQALAEHHIQRLEQHKNNLHIVIR